MTYPKMKLHIKGKCENIKADIFRKTFDSGCYVTPFYFSIGYKINSLQESKVFPN